MTTIRRHRNGKMQMRVRIWTDTQKLFWYQQIDAIRTKTAAPNKPVRTECLIVSATLYKMYEELGFDMDYFRISEHV